MEQTNNNFFESEGFRAHLFLAASKPVTKTKRAAKRVRWAYVATSKLTTVLAEETSEWGRAISAHEHAHEAMPHQLPFDFDLARRFQNLAQTWRSETKYVSSLSKIAMHPAYQKIIGMGKPVLPLILDELQKRGGHWLWALHVITDEDPAPVNATFGEAVQAWLSWGKANKYIR